MRKKLVGLVICAVVMTTVIIGAIAAEFTGRIWTGHPKRIVGIVYGYYCTAAQNTSSNGTNQWARAWSSQNGVTLADVSAIGNEKAIAKSGLNRPTNGFGEYSEDYGYASLRFGPGAYPEY